MVEIQDYIDPKCARHMMAYLYMQRWGEWPESFKRLIAKDHITFNNPMWGSAVDSKLASEWIKTRLLSGEYTDTINGIDRGLHMPSTPEFNNSYLKAQGVEIIGRE